MDTQPIPQSPIYPDKQPSGQGPEVNGMAPAEVGSPGGPGTSSGATPVAKPTLTPDEVAAAIAATPAVGQTPSAVVANPVDAADQDVIEPEWVDKAEQVVEQNAGNPFGEEEAVEGLQIDYLKKRYGHEVKKSEDT